MNKKRKYLKRWVRNTISIILLGVIAYSLYNIVKIKLDEDSTIKIQNEYKLPDVIENQTVTEVESYSGKYNNLKSKNSDFIGWIKFESGLIDLPFLQGKNNEYYLNKNFNKEYSSHGSIFQDYMQNLEGNNITLYGHYVYNNASIMFTPLSTLQSKENYEQNKYFSLYLESTIKTYEAVGIVKYNVIDEPLYQVGDLSADAFSKYRDYIYENRLYDTGVTIESDDKLLSLQTCVRNEDDTRWLVIGKLIEEGKIE